MLAVVSTDYRLKYPHCTASMNVLTDGLKYAAFMYAVKSCMFVNFQAALHCDLGGSFEFSMWTGPYDKGILHRSIYMYLFPMSKVYCIFHA